VDVLVREGTVTGGDAQHGDVVETCCVGDAGRGQLTILWLAHYNCINLFLDELVADHDGCLDGVGVHDLGGVVQTDVLREVHLLVVNFLCFHSESLSSGCAGENSSNIEPVGLVDLVLHVEGGGGQEEQEEGGGEWQGEQEGGGQGCQIGAGWKHFGRL